MRLEGNHVSESFIYKINKDNKTVTLQKYCGDYSDSVIIIPTHYSGMKIISIADRAFDFTDFAYKNSSEYCWYGDRKPKIYLPKSIKYIGIQTFRHKWGGFIFYSDYQNHYRDSWEGIRIDYPSFIVDGHYLKMDKIIFSTFQDKYHETLDVSTINVAYYLSFGPDFDFSTKITGTNAIVKSEEMDSHIYFTNDFCNEISEIFKNRSFEIKLVFIKKCNYEQLQKWIYSQFGDNVVFYDYLNYIEVDSKIGFFYNYSHVIDSSYIILNNKNAVLFWHIYARKNWCNASSDIYIPSEIMNSNVVGCVCRISTNYKIYIENGGINNFVFTNSHMTSTYMSKSIYIYDEQIVNNMICHCYTSLAWFNEEKRYDYCNIKKINNTDTLYLESLLPEKPEFYFCDGVLENIRTIYANDINLSIENRNKHHYDLRKYPDQTIFIKKNIAYYYLKESNGFSRYLFSYNDDFFVLKDNIPTNFNIEHIIKTILERQIIESRVEGKNNTNYSYSSTLSRTINFTNEITINYVRSYEYEMRLYLNSDAEHESEEDNSFIVINYNGESISSKSTHKNFKFSNYDDAKNIAYQLYNLLTVLSIKQS